MKVICSGSVDCTDTECPAHEPHGITNADCDHLEFYCPTVEKMVRCEPEENGEDDAGEG